MVTVKLLKPYYIKADDEYVRVILAYQYFSVFVQDELYYFIPTKAKEIRINRHTRLVANLNADFAFQKGQNIIHIPMSKLVSLPDFQEELRKIAEPYYIEESLPKWLTFDENAAIINELEQQNIKHLIDRALDQRNESLFHELVTKWL